MTASSRAGHREGGIVLLAGHSESSRIVYHALRREFGAVTAIVEDPVSRSTFVKRRLRKLGVARVAGQVLFSMGVLPVLRRRAAARIDELIAASGFDASDIPDAVRVSSVNSHEAHEALRRARPAVVVVNGTRIIGQQTLQAVNAPMLNMHAGITPMFRGVHGAYWALVERRPDLVGTTIHYVDRGIDTGGIIEQAVCAVTTRDSFVTYPYLQLTVGIPAMLRAVRAVLSGAPPSPIQRSDIPSVLRTHPTAWGYLVKRVVAGVR